MMTKCIPVAVQLLGSKVISDVLESLEFLSVAFEFQVCGSREGVRKALALVWSREQQVKDAVVNMYVRLYFNPQVRMSMQTDNMSTVLTRILRLSLHKGQIVYPTQFVSYSI